MNIQQFNIEQFQANKRTTVHDFIACENAFEIRLSHDGVQFQTLAITLCSPSDCEDLIYGYLFTENVITKACDIVKLTIFPDELVLIAEVILQKDIDFYSHLNKRHGMIHASCGICGKTEIDKWLTFKYPTSTQCNINYEKIIPTLPEKLRQAQTGFKQSGGLHASALFDASGQMKILREDIGRHNALDKLIGSCLRNKAIPLSNHILLLSGRISFELVHKSLMAGFKIICAIGAPSSLSIEIAKINKAKLYGFIKKNRFNKY